METFGTFKLNMYLCRKFNWIIMDTKRKDVAKETVSLASYGMSDKLRNSGILSIVTDLSHEDKACLIRYIHESEEMDIHNFEELNDEQEPYTMEELNARIDEAEEEIERGEGKTFNEMMNGFREKLLWLK
ncbi:MAG: hypothetical protein IJQ04_02445 [Prevotella sp.]|nr:hypothetical protein [Prevotella sp.]